jgi:hypothetical protein
MFSAIKSTFKKSEAAVVIQNLLSDHKARGACEGDPAFIATKLISLVWDQKPDLFNGKFGQRPHKLSVAAIALAQGLNGFAYNRDMQLACLNSLGTILDQLNVNGQFYKLNAIDDALISEAFIDYAAMGKGILAT